MEDSTLLRRWIGLTAGLALFVSLLPAQVRIPRGKNILPNGQFAPDEWRDSIEVKATEGIALFFKQDGVYLYLGIKFLAEMHTGIDLYLAELGGPRKKLHVSAALGEAEWKDGSWTDIQWGKNALWTANGIGLISENGERKVVPLEGFEFQISRALLPGNKWLLYFHLKRPDLFYPHAAGTEQTEDWLQITF
jgi:hypothetical protein